MTYHSFQPETVIPKSDYCKCGLHRMAPDHSEARTGGPEVQAMPVDEAVAALLSRIESLLGTTGQFAQCKGCMQGIYWFQIGAAAARRKIAYNRDGTNHFSSCSRQHEFAKSGGSNV